MIDPRIIAFLRDIATAGVVTCDTPELKAACIGLWERDLLIICPPGYRYKLSPAGYLAVETAMKPEEKAA